MTRHRYLLALLPISLIFLGMSLRAAPIMKEKIVEGTVIRAGEAKLTLMASSNGAIHRFIVASDATITRDGRNAKLEEIAFRDFALLSVKDNEDVRIATVIVALSPGKLKDRHR